MDCIAEIEAIYLEAAKEGKNLKKVALTAVARRAAKQVRNGYLDGLKGVISETGEILDVHPQRTFYVGNAEGVRVNRLSGSSRKMQEALAGRGGALIAEMEELAEIGIATPAQLQLIGR